MASSATSSIQCTNPATGEEIAQVPDGTKADVDAGRKGGRQKGEGGEGFQGFRGFSGYWGLGPGVRAGWGLAFGWCSILPPALPKPNEDQAAQAAAAAFPAWRDTPVRGRFYLVSKCCRRLLWGFIGISALLVEVLPAF